MQIRAGCSGFSGQFVGFFRLSEYLAFADNHRIESRRNPEEMLDALLSFVPVKWRCVIMRIADGGVCEATRNFIRRNACVRSAVNLHPTACRQQQRFGATGYTHERFSCCATCERLPG